MGNAVVFLGVDGGATRCRVRARDAAGVRLAEAEGPPANIYVDFDAAMRTIRGTIETVLARCPGTAPEDLAVGLGLAGVAGPRDEARVGALLADFGRVAVANDAVTACIGANAGADGGVVIAGTGSAALAQVAGRRTAIGGRGFIVGDDGSGARIGYEAVRAALRAHDGIEPMTALGHRIMEKFGNDPVSVQDWGRTAQPSDFGAFAPMVFEAAREADPVAGRIVAEAAEAIAALGRAIGRLGAERIALVGGLAEVIRPFLGAADTALFSPALLDPIDGAILFAGGTV